MIKRKYSIISGLIALFCFILVSSSMAEFDNTRKMKAEAQYYFDKGEYYKAINIWAEALKIDSYDKEAVEGISKAQKLLEETRGEKEKAERQRLRELIQEGKNYYRDKEYKKALSSWGQALSIDPTNKEVLDLIEEARIRAQYQISILDKLDREKRLKTPHIKDLDKIADKMINLLEKADVEAKKEKRKEIEKELEEELIRKEKIREKEGEKEFIRDTFAKGEEFYKKGRFEEAISEWNEILPYLPKSSEIAIKIAELKERIAAEEERKKKVKLEAEAKRKKRLEEVKEQEKAKVKEDKFPGKQVLLIIGIIVLLTFFIIKIVTGTKIKPHLAKMPPKKAEKEEFEPRDLKKYLKKQEDKDKDLFK